MNAHVALIQFVQVAILVGIIPILLFHVFRVYVKCKVFYGMYGLDIRRYVDDKILEETGNRNKKKDIL